MNGFSIIGVVVIGEGLNGVALIPLNAGVVSGVGLNGVALIPLNAVVVSGVVVQIDEDIGNGSEVVNSLHSTTYTSIKMHGRIGIVFNECP